MHAAALNLRTVGEDVPVVVARRGRAAVVALALVVARRRRAAAVVVTVVVARRAAALITVVVARRRRAAAVVVAVVVVVVVAVVARALGRWRTVAGAKVAVAATVVEASRRSAPVAGLARELEAHDVLSLVQRVQARGARANDVQALGAALRSRQRSEGRRQVGRTAAGAGAGAWRLRAGGKSPQERSRGRTREAGGRERGWTSRREASSRGQRAKSDGYRQRVTVPGVEE